MHISISFFIASLLPVESHIWFVVIRIDKSSKFAKTKRNERNEQLEQWFAHRTWCIDENKIYEILFDNQYQGVINGK